MQHAQREQLMAARLLELRMRTPALPADARDTGCEQSTIPLIEGVGFEEALQGPMVEVMIQLPPKQNDGNTR